MMQTRCPACGTSFHVTPEQMRARAGKVRCGKCRVVFNALAYLVVKVPESAKMPLPEPFSPAPPAAIPAVRKTTEEMADDWIAEIREPSSPIPPPEPTLAPELEAVVRLDLDNPPPFVPHAIASHTRLEPSLAAGGESGLGNKLQTAETSRLNSLQGAQKKETGVLLDNADPPVVWPLMTAAVLLVVVLLAQFAHYFRVDLAANSPLLAAAFKEAGVDTPMPRKPDLVNIDTSDLQSDPARHVLNLNATLVNKAAFAQAWPALELTLLDAQDNVISRRVFAALEYLGKGGLTPVFPPRHEVGIKLSINSENLQPAGYRVYVFYP